ncbi:MAG: hypothetical protein IPK25_08990 [Saprospiraceae bacterium]|nr:hypothetical protein [Saprospiraceae bacterium]
MKPTLNPTKVYLRKKTRIWSQPELGTLSGEIVKIQNNTLLLKDWTNKVWEISISESFVAPAVQLEKGIQIKMNGRKTGAYYFKADKVRPWEECRVNVWILSKIMYIF